MRLSLRARLCLLVGLAALPLLALDAYNGIGLTRHRVADAREDSLRWARLAAADQNDVIEASRQALLALSLIPTIRDANRSACAPLLADILRQFPHFAMVAVVAADDDPRCAAARDPAAGLTALQPPRPRSAAEEGDFIVGEYTADAAGRAVLPLGLRLRDSDQSPRGMLVAALDVEFLVGAARERPLGGATLIVTDRNGTILFCLPDSKARQGKTAPATLLPLVRAGGVGTAEEQGGDGDRFFGIVPVGTAPGTLVVAVGIDKAAIRARASWEIVTSLVLLLIGVGLAGGAAWWLGDRMVARPIGALASAARRWRKGDLAARADIRSTTELGALGAAFDAMAESIAQRETRLRDAKESAERAAEALADSEARLRLAQEVAGIGAWDWDIVARRVRWSDQLFRLVGREPGEAEPGVALWRKAVHPDDRAGAEATVRQTLADGHEFTTEYRIRHPDGAVRWIVSRGRVIRDDAGKACRMLGVSFDVTERRHAEEALQRLARKLEARAEARTSALAESEARYRLLADNAIDLITRTTQSGIRTYASPAARLVLGYQPEELIGAPSRALIHPDDQPLVAAASASLRERREARRVIQYRARHKQGHWVWVEAAQRLVIDPSDPDSTDIVSVIRDVTERRQLEERLRASEARASAFFEHTTAGVVLVAAREDGNFVYEAINPAHCAYTGFSREEYEGHTPQQIFPPETAERIVERYRRCIATGESIAFEEVFPFPTGVRAEQVTVTPIREASGRIRRILVSIHDVTEQKRAEEQLRQAQKMDAVGRLTGGVAHDFNNLLTAVIGNLEMALERAQEQPRLARLLQGALSAAERGASLTQRLLAFARKQHLRPEPVDVGALVLGIEDLLTRSLGPGIRLAVSAAPELWPARVDPNQLELAILNLAINARDAMPSGGALMIDIENRATAANSPPDLPAGDYVVVSVSDTGTGMSEEVLARAFDPFFTTKEVGKGSGLGLPMVQGFVAQSDGAISIHTAPGKGTMVALWLPRAAEAAQHRTRSALQPAPVLETGAARGTILLCDDDPDVRGFIAAFLRETGYAVREASGPAAALNGLAAARVDALVADYAMPEMTGAALAREARRRWPQLKVLIITGDAEALTQSAEHLPLLLKPFKPAQLADRLAQLLAEESVTP